MILEKALSILASGKKKQYESAVRILGKKPSEDNVQLLLKVFCEAADAKPLDIHLAIAVIDALGCHKTTSSANTLISIIERKDGYLFKREVLYRFAWDITDETAEVFYNYLKGRSNGNIANNDHEFLSTLTDIVKEYPYILTNQDCIDLLEVYQRYVIDVIGPLLVSRSVYECIPTLLAQAIPFSQSDFHVVKSAYLTTAFTLMDAYIQEHPETMFEKEFAMITKALNDLKGSNSEVMVNAISNNSLNNLKLSLSAYMECNESPLTFDAIKEFHVNKWSNYHAVMARIDREVTAKFANYDSDIPKYKEPETREEIFKAIESHHNNDCDRFFKMLAEFKDPQDIPFFYEYLYINDDSTLNDQAAFALMTIAPGEFNEEIMKLYLKDVFHYPDDIIEQLLATEKIKGEEL